MLAHLLLEDNQVSGTGGKNRYHTVAGLLHGLDDGEQRSNPHAASAAHHSAEALYVRGLAQRTHNIVEILARLLGADFTCGIAHSLHHQRDSAALRIGIRDGKRYPLPLAVAYHNHEMPRLTRPGNHRRLHHKLHHLLREVPLFQNLVHVLNLRG